MAPRAVNLVVEVAGTTKSATGDLKTAASATRVISMTQAFRAFDWLRLKPLMNASGDLRGMVINANARSVYDIAIKGGNLLNNISNFAAVVIALSSVYDESATIVNSTDDPMVKAAKLSTQVSSAAMRAITGILIVPEVLTLSHALFWVSREATQYFPGQQEGFGLVAEFASDYSANVVSTFQTFTDGNNIYNYIQTVVNPD